MDTEHPETGFQPPATCNKHPESRIQYPVSSIQNPCVWQHFGLLDYEKARKHQLQRLEDKCRDREIPDLIMTLEHPPVFTLGRQGRRDSLLVSDSFLLEKGVGLCQAERGGDITYHGPGQLVVYPIMDLRRARLRLTGLVHGLEEVMVNTAADFGVVATRSDRNRGVWVGAHKLGSIGLAVRRGISFHGLALNVSLDLQPFTWINPCGLQGVSMTSLERAGQREVIVDEVRKRIEDHLCRTFHLQALCRE